jgi:hypothetical protein
MQPLQWSYKFPFEILVTHNFSNMYANKDPLFTSGITEIWKLTAQAEEAFTISVQSFHKVFHNPQLYVYRRQKQLLEIQQQSVLNIMCSGDKIFSGRSVLHSITSSVA